MAVTSIPIPSTLFPNLRSLHPSLLFQFLLGNFLKCYATTQELEAYYNGCALSKIPPGPPKRRREELLEGVTELSGQLMTFAPTFPWTVQQGSLKSFVHYAHLMQPNQHQAPLVERSERAYRQALLCRDHLLTWKASGQISPLHLKALSRSMHSLIRNMHKAGQQVTKELASYAHNENVIFFLLRHRREFDTLFHAPYVVSLLDRIYRGGVDQAQQHLIRQYTKRGFENLLPQVTQVFADAQSSTH